MRAQTGLAIIVLLLAISTPARGQQIAFTFRNLIDCPITISSFLETKAYGFESVVLRNDVDRPVTAVYLRVAMRTESGDEVVEDRRVDIFLEPHDTKRAMTGLGHVEGLRVKARSLHRERAIAILSVKLIEYDDRTSWQPAGSVEGIPGEDSTPPPLPRLIPNK